MLGLLVKPEKTSFWGDKTHYVSIILNKSLFPKASLI